MQKRQFIIFDSKQIFFFTRRYLFNKMSPTANFISQNNNLQSPLALNRSRPQEFNSSGSTNSLFTPSYPSAGWYHQYQGTDQYQVNFSALFTTHLLIIKTHWFKGQIIICNTYDE